MDEQAIAKRIEELRTQFPRSFSHPKAREGEVCLGFVVNNFWGVGLLEAGMTSARAAWAGDTMEVGVARSGETIREKVNARTIFVNLREFVLHEHKLRRRT